jgi:hypothetical protein
LGIKEYAYEKVLAQATIFFHWSLVRASFNIVLLIMIKVATYIYSVKSSPNAVALGKVMEGERWPNCHRS